MSLDQQKVQQAERVYEDFEPPSDWAHDESSDTLILMLPGFKREELKVQIASTRILRLSGEREMGDKKWRQFRKEFAIPDESDTSGVSAKFESGILYINLPKHIKTQPPPTIQHPPKSTNPPPPPPPPPAPTPVAPPKKEKEKSEATTSRAQGGVSEAKIDKRSLTLELLSRQTQEYKNAVSGLVEEVKKQKKLANFIILIFLVLVFGFYVKNAMNSSLGRTKIEEL
ncbi:hypothetical protein Lal_00025163 [Lupinus albus]|uniref:Putative HSP20-like chaperone n=1 Tax=Lupinus albus TaxID=3870 RepID=A0A6A5NXW6_LUPAL|nr:putative HSP20-like chaperone [Lupinus albus]KAF1889834.1 hypothetical protein Lal_00025163 [Lupinus albus]